MASSGIKVQNPFSCSFCVKNTVAKQGKCPLLTNYIVLYVLSSLLQYMYVHFFKTEYLLVEISSSCILSPIHVHVCIHVSHSKKSDLLSQVHVGQTHSRAQGVQLSKNVTAAGNFAAGQSILLSAYFTLDPSN